MISVEAAAGFKWNIQNDWLNPGLHMSSCVLPKLHHVELGELFKFQPVPCMHSNTGQLVILQSSIGKWNYRRGNDYQESFKISSIGCKHIHPLTGINLTLYAVMSWWQFLFFLIDLGLFWSFHFFNQLAWNVMHVGGEIVLIWMVVQKWCVVHLWVVSK